MLLKRIQTENCEEAKIQLEFITKFNNEFHKNVVKKGDPKALHKTDELRRDCYARENARNRDVMSVRATVSLVERDDMRFKADAIELLNDEDLPLVSWIDQHENEGKGQESAVIDLVDLSIEADKSVKN